MKNSVALVLLVAALRLESRLWAYEEDVGTVDSPLSVAPQSNSSASSRPTSDRCIQGYVWREARANDHVCVTTTTREAVKNQNRSAQNLWVSGAYGPQTCREGYVWREAFPGDTVCVSPKFRDLTQRDNQLAAGRVVK